ncbi:hypothetical protein [Plantactinospora sp. B24E8]|uniref:LppU/SCO3897 family protein n=1 Tax=Plantactinospora sp. B24E8 TaxID=3153567 RepID=UPI00325F7744
MSEFSGPPQQQKKSFGTWFRNLRPVSKFRVILFGVAILVAPFAIYFGLDEPNQAKVGDCMAGETAETLHTVECTDAAAQWKVLARLGDKTEADYTEDSCADHPTAEMSFFQDGRRFSKGFILCLGPAAG